MRGFIGTSPGSLDTRHRSFAVSEGNNKRKSQRSRDYKEVDKTFIQGRGSSCKPTALKLFLVLIVTCGTFLILIQSPVTNENEYPQQYGFSSSFADGWIWNWRNSDSHYTSNFDVEWMQILKAIKKINGRSGLLRVALLNFNETESNFWKQVLPGDKTSVIHLEHAGRSVTWEALYPEWIDEEEESEVPTCPSLPEPRIAKRSKFNLIAVKLPCNKSGKWSRDVARLHLLLSAAKLAAASAEGQTSVHVLLVTECFPLPNLFRCKDLVFREGITWLYKPDLGMLKEKIRLPVGSCKLALPLKTKDSPVPPSWINSCWNGSGFEPSPSKLKVPVVLREQFYSKTAHRQAYATILHSAHIYVCGAIAAAQSIRMAGSNRDLVILVDENISDLHRGGLESAGWKVQTIEMIRNPKAEPRAYNEWNYSKFRLWQLTDYDKIIFIDSDLLILRNMDFLFAMPEISAIGNHASLFNSGVMVIEPSNCTFQFLMDRIHEIESYNGGDQGYLNEVFTWWHRIPRHMNYLKHFWEGDGEDMKQKKTHLFGADPPLLYVIHYLGMKPWLCFRDYDCNWNVGRLQEFASDVAHARWWKVHDAMPENLQNFCLLKTKRKAKLELSRRKVAKANFSDGHWSWKIGDKRLNICSEEFCSWEAMLHQLGKTHQPTATLIHNISSL